ncbi:MAG TPA: discoidin domain-containing protein, partial [candidate division Zixibacteria bacterium]|nr:discoidin domain-containing protein [candidate division Zixibacteria bacterium]
GKAVRLGRPASPKYHDGDRAALTDGLKAWDDYHMHWLGFEGEDMDATVDLGTVRTISRISTSFLQDINSWVFMPESVTFSVSTDGRDYRLVGTVRDTVPADRGGKVVAPFNVAFAATNARFVRVYASSLKTCPTWHKGSGGPAWIFIDEIAVE